MGQIWRRRVALPQDHGAWLFLLSPLAIGMVVAGGWSLDLALFGLLSLALFFLRQPLDSWIKIRTGRAHPSLLRAAQFWSVGYGVLALLTGLLLLFRGHLFLFWLALPAGAIWGYHLVLVRKQCERHQLGVQLMATGALALAAPAALWVGRGEMVAVGWWLWLLSWLHSAASVVFVYLRLEQLRTARCIAINDRLPQQGPVRSGRRALLYSSFNPLFVAVLTVVGPFPRGLVVPFMLQWFETVGALWRPSLKAKPVTIGLRQVVVSSLFTLLFLLFWE